MRVYVVTYEHKHGVDVGVYSTEDKAWAAIDKIKADNPGEFQEDDQLSWTDITCCELDS